MEKRRAVLKLGDLLEERSLRLELRTGGPDCAGRAVLGAAVVEVESPARWIEPEWVLLTAGGVLSGDSTMAAYYGAVHFLAMDAARRWIYPTGYATLGYALPAAIGAKLAAPDRPVIALVGDGGLLFTVAELAMAAELGIPLPVVVPNNSGYGEIRAQMREQDIDPIGVDLGVPDLPALGRAFGGAGLRVDEPAALVPALREALERPGPTVIEVPASA